MRLGEEYIRERAQIMSGDPINRQALNLVPILESCGLTSTEPTTSKPRNRVIKVSKDRARTIRPGLGYAKDQANRTIRVVPQMKLSE